MKFNALFSFSWSIGLMVSFAPTTVFSQNIWDEVNFPASSQKSISSSSSISVSSALSPSSISSINSSSLAVSSSSTALSSAALMSPLVSTPISSEISSSSLSISSSEFKSSSSQTVEPAISRKELLGNIKVSKVNTIDEIKGTYRSPKTALFLSLALPGAGQMYVGQNTFNWVRGGVYLALEAVTWGGYVYYGNKYDQQIKKAKNHLNAHFDLRRWNSESLRLFSLASDKTTQDYFSSFYYSQFGSLQRSLFGEPKNQQKYLEANDLLNQDSLTSFENRLNQSLKSGFSDEEQYYLTLEAPEFVLGWDDVDPATKVSNINDLQFGKEGDIIPLGFSNNALLYSQMRNKANDYAEYQKYYLVGVIIHHIGSALDAAITAHCHNKRLYQEEVAWYEHIRLNTGSSVFAFNQPSFKVQSVLEF